MDRRGRDRHEVVGDGSVIGAKTVVTKDVQPYSVVVGSPARVIKRRGDCTDEVVERMEEIKWWAWEEARLKRCLPVLQVNFCLSL